MSHLSSMQVTYDNLCKKQRTIKIPWSVFKTLRRKTGWKIIKLILLRLSLLIIANWYGY